MFDLHKHPEKIDHAACKICFELKKYSKGTVKCGGGGGTSVSAPLGAPSATDHGRDAAYHRDKKENDENYQMAQAIVNADWEERNKAERAEEDTIKIQDFILNSDDDLLTRFPTVDGLVDFLLHHCTFAEFPTSTDERAADALPFGAKTIHEAI